MSILIITAIVLGGLLGDACAGTEYFNWLSYGKTFSFQTGTIDIVILSLNLGFSFSLNIAQLILIIAALFAFYKVAPRLITSK